ncbi:glycosyl hydrolase family 76-domain-containing protein [Sphaerosporella brunnea]|uniref:Glycosyl hydrolase family 76-domain-containing protein n=1 Tax=Sphaerosporella brunnea TaxID=1250544 RepID=A0A5J5F5M1_9PEZI|nr:glycosyl hydrolase family 76-domain-containing protein [Sphaerosporella brunnea]
MQEQLFDLKSGSWPRGIDWTSAVLGTHLAAASRTLTTVDLGRANKYLGELIAFFYGQNSESLKLQAYDDILWVVLNWLEAVQMINHRVSVLPAGSWTAEEWKSTFAGRAYEFYQIANEGWDDKLCDGGMVWSPWLEPYKNAITNELYISASISMYLHHPYPARNETYLWNAIRAHEWLIQSNMTDATGLYTDGFHISNLKLGGNRCDKRDEMVYTYNQGVLLSGLRGLAEATNDDKYIIEGLNLIDAVLSSEGTAGELVFDGILTEKCDPGGYCSQNGQTFKGIFMHHLTAFCQPIPTSIKLKSPTNRNHRVSCTRYKAFIKRSAAAALLTRNEHGVIGSWWGVPAGLLSSPQEKHDTRPAGTQDIENMCISRLSAKTCEAAQRPASGHRRGDLNDRGRGRTVESHSGGLAALRAVLELERGGMQ